MVALGCQDANRALYLKVRYATSEGAAVAYECQKIAPANETVKAIFTPVYSPRPPRPRVTAGEHRVGIRLSISHQLNGHHLDLLVHIRPGCA